MSEEKPTAAGSGGKLRRALGLRDVVLFNIVAIVGLRWLSTAAQTGPSSLVLWLLALVLFFIPSGLAVMELTTRIPGEGGVYQWSRRAFGNVHGFLAGWSYWVSNLVYYPSLLMFVGGVFLFVGGEAWLGLGDNPLYNTAFALGVMWFALILNMVGLSRGKWVQNLGGIGTWVTAALLIGFGVVAWVRGGSSTAFDGASLWPDLTQVATLSFFATMTFGFAGLELAPIMAGEIRQPGRTIPRAILISGVVIVAVYMLGTAVLLVALPSETVDVISGVPQALAVVGERAGVPGLARLAAILITLGSLGGVGAWVAGTARLPYVAGVDRYLPQALSRVHPRWGTPHVALLVQGVLCSLFLLMAAVGSSVEQAYVVLVDMTIVLYFIPFLYMFAALPILRLRSAREEAGVNRVPGGLVGVWLVALLGLLATSVSLGFAVIPLEGLAQLKVVGGCAALIAVGLVFYARGRRSAASS